MVRSPLVAAALVFAMALSADAWANSNVIPDAESAMNSGLESQNPQPGADLIGFKAGLGRIDRIHLFPGKTTGFRIQPDGQCVQATEEGLTVRRMAEESAKLTKPAKSDYVAALLSGAAPGGDVLALVLASEQLCNELNAGIGQGAGKGGVDLRCEPLAPVIGTGGPFHVRVGLPTDLELYGGDGEVPSGPVKVVLTEGLPSPAEYLALLSNVFADGCAASCDELMKANALGCAGSFYVVLKDGEVALDPTPCHVAWVSEPPKNKFKELCEDMNPPPADLAHCENGPDPTAVLRFWEDQCGGIHIPFDWTGIRETTSTPPTAITRVVAGRSATSRTEKGRLDSERIWIPGPEFLGSTPWNAASGTYGTSDWQKTDIDVCYDDSHPHEICLDGSIDQEDAVVHVYPRMPVSIVCASGSSVEGCMRSAGLEDGVVTCACRDRYAATCQCSLARRPMYFECDGGDYDGMPCTRHAHCDSRPNSKNPNGSCSRQPTCRPPNVNAVWRGPWSGPPPPTPPTGPGQGKCWDDGDCQGNRTCGHRLFDLKDRWELHAKRPSWAKPLILLDAKIPNPAKAKQRRGVCKEDRSKLCNQDSPAEYCKQSRNDVCRGFTLRAGGQP